MQAWLRVSLVADFYRIFDTTLQCDFPLPELPAAIIENGFRVKPGMTRGSGHDIVLSVKLGEGDPDQ